MILAYVCTNFNNTHFTAKAVDSFLNSTAGKGLVVVVDNASEQSQVEQLQDLKTKYPNVEVIFNRTNLGYFKGLNAGVRRLRELHPDCEFAVVGNNDLVFPSDFAAKVRSVRKVLEQHPVVSPDVVTLEGVHQNPHVINGISWMRELVYDIYHLSYPLAKLIQWLARFTHPVTDRSDETHWRVPQAISQGHGSCYLLGPVFFREFKEFWAPTMLLGEEYFLSKQLEDRGMSVFYEPTVRVQHHCHATIGKVPAKKVWQFSREAHRIRRQHVKIFG